MMENRRLGRTTRLSTLSPRDLQMLQLTRRKLLNGHFQFLARMTADLNSPLVIHTATAR